MNQMAQAMAISHWDHIPLGPSCYLHVIWLICRERTSPSLACDVGVLGVEIACESKRLFPGKGVRSRRLGWRALD